jgi:bifunctional DNA-binding transcriptional regulator/antitoxin component of YhaV-PrlF toxin-antitoxin module
VIIGEEVSVTRKPAKRSIQVSLDEGGRILVPAAACEHLGLSPGMALVAEETGEGGVALRLVDEQDALLKERFAELRREITVGLDQLRRGEGIPGEEVFEELRQRSLERRQKKA